MQYFHYYMDVPIVLTKKFHTILTVVMSVKFYTITCLLLRTCPDVILSSVDRKSKSNRLFMSSLYFLCSLLCLLRITKILGIQSLMYLKSWKSEILKGIR